MIELETLDNGERFSLNFEISDLDYLEATARVIAREYKSGRQLNAEKAESEASVKCNECTNNINSAFPMIVMLALLSVMNSNSADSYCKGKSDAYERVIFPDKKDESAKRAQDVLDNFKNALEGYRNKKCGCKDEKNSNSF